MAAARRRNPSPPAPELKPLSPASIPRASALLRALAALDAEPPEVAGPARERLRAEAEHLGLRLESIEITDEPIPDPEIEALPAAEREHIAAITHRMYEDPGALCDELEEVVARHPHIPMLRNHLYMALATRGQHDRARDVLAELRRLFPDYLFGLCNHVMALLSDEMWTRPAN